MTSKILDNLQCLILFGSHARGDIDQNSDLDLLGVDNSNQHKTVSINKVNLSLYSYEHLVNMAKNGDPFVFHLINEGKCFFGKDIFDLIKESFQYKADTLYLNDAKAACYLANKIYQNRDAIVTSKWWLANKRISWCIRTIIISLLMCKRRAVFSKHELAMYIAEQVKKINLEDAFLLVDAKSHKNKDTKILEILFDFISSQPELLNVDKIDIYNRDIISKTINSIISDEKYDY